MYWPVLAVSFRRVKFVPSPWIGWSRGLGMLPSFLGDPSDVLVLVLGRIQEGIYVYV